MATRRQVVHPQPVKGNLGELKNGGAKNRPALGDIGNIGVDGGKINRPLTRSFRAQLLENAQKKQANPDKNLVLDGARVVAKKKQAVQKKAPAVPSKPIEVIEISPDTNEVQRGRESKKHNAVVSSMKKTTYSSVLNARSKAASKILDIDDVDKDNDLAAVEYVQDIYTFYKEVEDETKPQMYMHIQPEINQKMRSILVDWLVEVHAKVELSTETLYLTVNIVDRFLSRKPIPRRELQLLGVSALLIASKYEEIWPPQVDDLVYLTDNCYDNKQILVMEKTILANLEWYLTVPTQYVFLVRFIKASDSDSKLENMVHFLAALGLMHYDTLMFSPSMLAASAVYTARCCLNRTPTWTDTLRFHTGYSESQLMDCSKLLALIHSRAGESKLRGVIKMYTKLGRGAVALISPAKTLLSDP